MKKKIKQKAPKANVKGYSDVGASLTRRALKGFIPNSSSANEDINSNNRTLRQRARMLYMASPVATSAINTTRTKVVGTGLFLKSTINSEILGLSPERAKTWERSVEAEFSLWADEKNNCDALGLNNFHAIQQLALKSWLMSGDVFVLIKRYSPTPTNPYSLRLHLIEADRVCTPFRYVGASVLSNMTEGVIPEGEAGAGNRIYDGVEVDEQGKVVAYHVCNVYPQESTIATAKWTRIPAYGEKTGLPNVIHVMESERPEQYRGVPYLAQVIEPLLQLRRYTESELMAALVQSFFTAWIETEADKTEMPFNEVGAGEYGDTPTEYPESGVTESENEYELGPGTVIHLNEGEKVVFGNPNIPTAGFETFVKTICKLVGSALEIPTEVLLKEFGASYSASRGALLEAWEVFKMRRKWFVDDFCQPVFNIWLSEAVALGRIKAVGFFGDPLIQKAYCCAKWIGPVQGQLDPRKEVQASILMRDNGIKTNAQITRELGGGDWEDNIEQLILENEKLAQAQALIKPNEFADTESEGDV